MAERNGTKTLFDKIRPLIDSEIEKRTRSCCRTKSMVVTTAYNAGTQTVGVSEAAGNEINIPVCGNVDVAKLTVGTPVWVFSPYSSMSNAIVFMLGDGETGYAVSAEYANNSQMLNGHPASYYVPPIGIVLPFWDNTEPAAIWGGTWELIGSGRTLIQSGSGYALGATGGEASHTLTVDEMPSHSHGEYGDFGSAIKRPLVSDAEVGAPSIQGTYFTNASAASHTTNSKHLQTSKTGGNQPHNNMPPYLAVNFWKRTA